MTNDNFAAECARLADEWEGGSPLYGDAAIIHRALRCCARIKREGVLNVLRNNCGDDVSLGVVADAVLAYLLREDK